MFYYSHRAIVCAVARQMRYHLKTSAEARARVVEVEAECHDEDGDGFVVCGHCGEGGGDHATEDCPGVDEECPGDEDDYDYQECCDSGCKYKGHWYKKEPTQN